ncbi:MAG: hypothetical protein H0W62_10405 [Chitinophagales bacterium]|nr:hypothetical protein [Chitinophagales bacterium]
MEKVLIISYYFPPANMPASFRVLSWAQYLKSSGYYPIIITRRWDNDIKTPGDLIRKSVNTMRHEKSDDYEVYALPHQESLRDKIYLQMGKKLILVRKLLTFYNAFLENFSSSIVPYKNLYRFAKAFLADNRDIKKLIITGNPFPLFRLGYLFHQEFNIHWIADYRDEWSTTDWDYLKSGWRRFTYELEKKSEKKWIKTSSAITTVTPYFVQKLHRFHQKPASVVYNGFFEKECASYRKLNSYSQFTFTFAGTLYHLQEIESTLRPITLLIKEYEKRLPIRILFPGLGFDKVQENRVTQTLAGFENNYKITPRIPKNELLSILGQSHIMLLLSAGNLKGNIQAKLFDYIGLHKPVLLYPSDHDILEQILIETRLGIIPTSEKETYSMLKKIIDKYLTDSLIDIHPNIESINKFSREEQAKAMVKVLDNL